MLFRTTFILGILAVAASIFIPVVVLAEERGELQLRFLVDGPVPQPTMFNLPNGEQLNDESLVVDNATGALANVIVWLAREMNPNFKDATKLADVPKEPALLTIAHNRFSPHLLLIRANQPLEVINEGPFGCNPRIGFTVNQHLNFLVHANAKYRNNSIDQPERFPTVATDSIKPWYKSYIFVTDHSYVATSAADGIATIHQLPIGEWTFRVWHERLGFVKKVNIGGNSTAWEKGLATFKVEPGSPTLKDVKIASDELKIQ